MRILKGLAAFITAAAAVSVFSLTAYADTGAAIECDKNVANGELFKVEVTINSDEDIGLLSANLSYNEEVIEFVDGDGSGGGGHINVQGFPDTDPQILTLTLYFQAVGQGDSQLMLQNAYVFSPEGIVIGNPGVSANVTVTGEVEVTTADIVLETEPTTDTTTETQPTATEAPETAPVQTNEPAVTQAPEETETVAESTETEPTSDVPLQGVLVSLTVDHGKLVPDFSYDVYDYTVNVGYEVDNVEIEGVTASPYDYIWYEGSSECAVGENIRTITVTDSNGISTAYTVRIIRAEEGQAVSEEESSEVTKDSSAASSRKDNSEKYKKTLNPALAIVLIVLVVSLVIIIMWTVGRFKKLKKK